ncbi:biosynthetic-type acetolactate synthase large subunit [Candidatus Thiothrix sp. Deng01]|uniref:Acetolactate synthase n=1 Tax=Candidatus Thiothrix phosphatis TaxID=3112415 RepID=A0ABU6CRU7_9GAMM|nr:biosynthetic-type acetolactate synthase large subunit [Candidatus Thiothrix sp. Deng01]MEB4589572.1 biosynthetic-type acetolactate synthase large subunit [Candidatus Thiothrix sp. Deng01]
MELTGAEIFVECLKEEGVDTIFGYPGGAVLFIYDELYKQQDKVNHILVRHEQGAVHAAEGYAKATNKPGVALVTSGPGATNAVTGIADAYMDSVPLVVFTGQVPRNLIGNDAFQEVDIVGITRPCVKHNFLVTDVKELASTIKKAFYIASTGRPGPVLVDIPKDITTARCEFHYPKEITMRSYNPTYKGNKRQVRRAIDLMLEAKKPVLYTGGGVVLSGAANELTELTQELGFPITETLMGLGAYPSMDKQFIGMLGMHGTYEANNAMHHADLVIAIGARFDDRVTGNIEKFCPYAKIIHIDIDPASISKNVKVDVPIVGDVKHVIIDLLEELRHRQERPDAAALAGWWKQIEEWRKANCLKYNQDMDGPIRAQYVIEKFWEITNGDAYICSDVGQHQMWAAQYYRFNKPNRWINSGGLGTMGFGLPAAMGVQMAFPEETVACVTGDGSIQMCIQELGTCLQYRLPVKILCLNNGFLGMVRQWQEFFYQKRYAMSYMEALPDFVKLAEAYGHVGMRIEKPGDVEGAIKEALAMKDRLVFMDFITLQENNVYPMVPAGAGHNEMILV